MIFLFISTTTLQDIRYLCKGRHLMKRAIDYIILYLAAVMFCCGLLDCIVCILFKSMSANSLQIVRFIAYILGIVFVVLFVRVRPLTNQERREGPLFSARLRRLRP